MSAVTTSNTTAGALVTVPLAALLPGASVRWISGTVECPDEAERITMRVESVDCDDDTMRVRVLTDEDADRYRIGRAAVWMHVKYLQFATPEYKIPTTEESTMVSPTAAAVTAALDAQRAEHAAEMAAERETAERRIASQRSNAAAAARIERDEEVGEALAQAIDDEIIDADTAAALAQRLGVEIPEREYEVEITITETRTIRVKATNAASAQSLAADGESWVSQSVTLSDGYSLEGDDDLEIIDDGDAYGNASIEVTSIERV